MSETESDFLSYPGETEDAHGYNATSVSSWQQHHFSRSRMDLPRNFERQRYPESMRSRTNMYYEREASPMSVRSYREPHNYQHSHYSRAIGSYQSMINGRCVSPSSERSINSNITTMKVMDLSNALLTRKFNKDEFKIIEKVFTKIIERGRTKMHRSKIEKRWKRKFRSKPPNRTTGYDSGELGSDSSISDDLRSGNYNTSASCKGSVAGSRSYSRNSLKLASAIKKNNMYEDRTADIQQCNFRNVLSMASGSMYTSRIELENSSVMTRNPKMNSSYQIGSHRFNNTISALSIKKPQAMSHYNNIPSNISILSSKSKKSENYLDRRKNNGTLMRHTKKVSATNIVESDAEDMFTNREKDVNNFTLGKNTIIKNNVTQKSNSIAKKTSTNPKMDYTNNETNKVDGNDFEFARPQFPIKKSLTRVKETLISRSPSVQCVESFTDSNKKSQTHKESEILDQNDFAFARPQFPINKSVTRVKEKLVSKSVQCAEIESVNSNEKSQTDKESEMIDHSSSDISSRPSFMKRKLFTQTLDVTECKNISSESFNSNSPQTNVYNQYAKEKNKARKLAVGQSCLSRDINQDKNLIELIQEIVPEGRMNLTMSTTRVERSANDIKTVSQKRKTANDPSDRWDITSIISCNNDSNVSDTYTDEEIINVNTTNKKKKLKTSLEFKTNIGEKNKNKSVVNKNSNLISKDTLPEKREANELKKVDGVYELKRANEELNTVTKHSVLSKRNKIFIKKTQTCEDKNSEIEFENKRTKRYSYIDRFWDEDSDMDINEVSISNKGNATMETLEQNDRKLTSVTSTAKSSIPEIMNKNGKTQADKEDDQNKTKRFTDRPFKKVIKCTTNDIQDKGYKTNKIIKKTTSVPSGKKLTSVSTTAKSSIPEVENNDGKDQEDKGDVQNKTKRLTNKAIKKVMKCATNEAKDKSSNKIIKQTTPVQIGKKLTSVLVTAKSSLPEIMYKDGQDEENSDNQNKIIHITDKPIEDVTNNIQNTINKTNKIAKKTIPVESEEQVTKASKSYHNKIKSSNTMPRNKKKEQVLPVNALTMPKVNVESYHHNIKSSDTVQENKKDDKVKSGNTLTGPETKIFSCNDHVKTSNTVQDTKKKDKKVMRSKMITESEIISCDNQIKSTNTLPNNGKLCRELSRLDSSFLPYSELLKLSNNSLDAQKDNSMVLRKRNNSELKNAELDTSIRVLRTRLIDKTNSLNSSNIDKEQSVKRTSQKENKPTKRITSQVKNKEKNPDVKTTIDTIVQAKQHTFKERGLRNISVNASSNLKSHYSNRSRRSNISFFLKA